MVFRIYARFAAFTLALSILVMLVAGLVPAVLRSDALFRESDCDLGLLFEGMSDQHEERGLYWMRPDGSGLEQVVGDFGVQDVGFYQGDGIVLSPDGTHMTVTYLPEVGGQFNFGLLEISTGELDSLTADSTYNKRFVWSPDGTRIAYMTVVSGQESVSVIDLTTGEEWEIANANHPDIKTINGGLTQMRWSPDGESLVLGYYATPVASKLVVVNADGSDLQRVSPTSQNGLPHLPDALRLFSGNASSIHTWAPDWLNNHTLLHACGTAKEGWSSICVTDLRHSPSVRIADMGRLLDDDDSFRPIVAALDVAPDGRVVFVTGTTGVSEFYVYDQRTVTNISEISGGRGTLPEWRCRPESSG